MSGRPDGLHLVAELADEYGDLAEHTGNGDLAALVVQLRAVLDLAAGQVAERCTKVSPGLRLTCLQSLTEGWCMASDLCPRCTRRFMAALGSAVGEGELLSWHHAYVARARS